MNRTNLAAVLFGIVSCQDWQDTTQQTTVYSQTLQLDQNGKFIIAQLGDIMNNGVPADYIRTQAIIDNIVQNVHPNLIVITGDTVDPAKSKNFKSLYTQAMSFIKDSGIPWVWTGGSQIAGLSRDQVLGIDQELSFKNSWSGYQWDTYNDNSKYADNELGIFTSRIPIMDKTGKSEVFSVYVFDSEDFACSTALNLPGTNCIGSNAVSWFTEQQMLNSHNYKNRDLIFAHQPLQEFMSAANVQQVWGVKEQYIDCQAVNSGLFSAALTNGKTGWIGVGGDPYNDFMTIYHGINISTARKTGTGKEGLTRGARIFTIDGTNVAAVKLSSYSVDENGTKNPGYEIRYPPSFSFGNQLQCSVDPFQGLSNQ